MNLCKCAVEEWLISHLRSSQNNKAKQYRARERVYGVAVHRRARPNQSELDNAFCETNPGFPETANFRICVSKPLFPSYSATISFSRTYMGAQV